MTTIYWTQQKYNDHAMHIAATSRGLCYVGSPHETIVELKRWANRHFQPFELVQDDAFMQQYVTELGEYWAGKRRNFTFAIDLHGTAFQLAVWEALQTIPYGQTASYSDLARLIGKPQAARAVGAALGANPVMIAIPCHRIIGKNGALTGFGGGLPLKKSLLALEQDNK